MPLNPGTRLGPYQVTAHIGSGGMGEVYRARDTKLNRDVALKILPALFANDTDRLTRFTREAQVLAALNHPNIASIYGIEESDDVRALVMELVEGDDLSTVMGSNPLPLSTTLTIARQIADALEAAHEQGIIHRDLKPANVKVRDDGTVKVLDFGLAKALTPEGTSTTADLANSPTLTSPAMTQMGMILGTAGYMSPEQARGKGVDRRTDIWAFGVVLYEMLTGRRAFDGESVVDVLGAVARLEPDFDALPTDVPARIRRVLQLCLKKDVRQRAQSMGDVRLALEGAFETSSAVAPIAPPRPLWRRALPVAVAAILTGVMVGAAVWTLRPRPAAPALTRFSWPLPEGQVFPDSGRNSVAISPDGTRVVYVANQHLYGRSLSQWEAQPVTGTEAFQSVASPVFSPDGLSVAFYAMEDSTIRRIPSGGGTAETICQLPGPRGFYGMSWGADGILFGSARSGIMRVSPTGGTPEVLLPANPGETAYLPQMLPDGQHVLFTLASGTTDSDRWDKAQIVVQSLGPKDRKVIVEGGTDGRYVPTGHVVFARGGALLAVAFDPGRLEASGRAVPVVDGLRRTPGLGGGAHYSVSSTGSLIFIPGPGGQSASQRTVGLFDRHGAVELLNVPAGTYEHPRVSPDGTRLALVTTDPKGDYVSIYDLAGTTAMRRLTFGGNSRYPAWSRDSRHVAFQSDREGDLAIFWQVADGTSPAERLTKPEPGTEHRPMSWSPKEDTLAFAAVKGADMSLRTFSRDTRQEAPFGTVHSSVPLGAVFSPDGRWVAYVSNETGAGAIYVQPFPPTGTKYQVSAEKTRPRYVLWSPDGTELFYSPSPGTFAAVPVTMRPAFAVGMAASLSEPFHRDALSESRPFDILPNGKFVGMAAPRQAQTGLSGTPELRVVLNWFDELKARVPGQ